MIYTILYKNNCEQRFKNVQADTKEEAKELLRQELYDAYNGWCQKENKAFSEESFKKRYKI